MDEFDYPDTNNIDPINIDVITSWQKIIYHGGQLTEIDADIKDSQFKSNSSAHYGAITGFLELLIDKIEMSEKLLTKVKYSCLSENSQFIILCNIIQDRLSPNYLQRVVVKKVISHVILNKENQYYYKSE